MLYVLLVIVILMLAGTIAYLWHLHPSMGGWLPPLVSPCSLASWSTPVSSAFKKSARADFGPARRKCIQDTLKKVLDFLQICDII